MAASALEKLKNPKKCSEERRYFVKTPVNFCAEFVNIFLQHFFCVKIEMDVFCAHTRVCVYVSVCESEIVTAKVRERESGREGVRDRERERNERWSKRVCECVCLCVCVYVCVCVYTYTHWYHTLHVGLKPLVSVSMFVSSVTCLHLAICI